jgi:hypothetical protein
MTKHSVRSIALLFSSISLVLLAGQSAFAETKTIEPETGHWYSAVDFGSNTLYATNGRQFATTSSGMQVTAKVGYSMSGPRVELESSVGSLASGSGSFNGTGVNAYYDFQTGSTRPYIGVGYGFGSVSSRTGSTSDSIFQTKLGVSFESSPGSNFYVELRGITSTDSNSSGIASLNVGNTFRF